MDENLPLRLSTLLNNLGHDVHTPQQERLSGHADQEISEAAQRESRFLITQGLDFSDSRRFAPGSHHGLLLVRLHSPSRGNLIERIGELFQQEKVSDWVGCFVVATKRKIRVRKPAGKQTS